MNTLRFRNNVVRSSTKVALATLLCVAGGVLQAKPSTPPAKPAAPAKSAAPAKPAASAKPAAAPRPSAPAKPAAPASGGARPAGTAARSTTTGGTSSPGAHPASPPARAGGANTGSTHAGPTTKAPTSVGKGPTSVGRNTKPAEHVTQTKSGAEVHRDAGGHVSTVHAKGMDIHHGPGGSRTIVHTRADGGRVVSNRYGHGYVGRSYGYHGVNYERRTYFYNGRVYGRFYRPYNYWGVPLDVYAPGFYFAPAFYGWAYYPWASAIAYPWGWAGNPWFAYCGAYFTPYAVYGSPALWLTDYYVAQTLQAAYAEQAAALASGQLVVPAPIPPDVKAAIAEEVRREIALERTEAVAGVQATPDPGSSGIARILTDNLTHVFVVSAALDVPFEGGTCGITEGDVLQLNPGTPANSSAATMVVLASKGPDCQRGASVQVGIADIQEMQNHLRETIDQGLGDLRAKQGQGGIPAAPAGAAAAPVQTGFAAIAPPDDPNVKSELSDTAKEGDQADRQALSESGGPNNEGADAPPTANVEPGQSPEQVVAILGQPTRSVNLGTRKIYVYNNLKITFVDGKVTSAE